MSMEDVSILSKHTIKPSPRTNKEEIIHLNPWDLKMLSMDYIQKGLLFHKPHNQPIDLILSNLRSSFTLALDHYYPLGGRLVTTNHDNEKSISIYLDCNDKGAEFVHASASEIRISDILAQNHYVPSVVHSFFPLNGILGHDGHDYPVLGVQVTELSDGIFVGCALNHTVADGTSFWNFFNTWSTISRTGEIKSIPSEFVRWFPAYLPPPVHLPFTNHQQFIRRVKVPPVRECAFSFSSANIRKLKEKANEEISVSSTIRISSLQALLAHSWRAVTRARGLQPHRETTYIIYAGYRSRLNPPLPQTYLGNSILGEPATASAGDIISKGLGWTAWLLNQAVAKQSEARAHDWVRSWAERPALLYLDEFEETNVFTGSSPRFDVYGNDFGWGRPVAVRSGQGSKINGKMTVYPGTEEGSMALEICLSAEILRALLQDREFMEVVD